METALATIITIGGGIALFAILFFFNKLKK